MVWQIGGRRGRNGMSGHGIPARGVRGSAFTLIELLVVVAVIMLLAGLLFPAYRHVRIVAKQTRAKADVKQLDTACRAVLIDYRSWPTIAGGGTPQAGRMVNSELVQFLQGGNTNGVIYMEFDSGSLNTNNAFADPWYHADRAPNNIYYVAFGSDGRISHNGSDVYREVGAWSRGVDGAESADDVKSWE
jgi:type II secretory pathway pseudopilin PulG